MDFGNHACCRWKAARGKDMSRRPNGNDMSRCSSFEDQMVPCHVEFSGH
ncbi:unnamed protein product [Ascophyllum nodosum]